MFSRLLVLAVVETSLLTTSMDRLTAAQKVNDLLAKPASRSLFYCKGHQYENVPRSMHSKEMVNSILSVNSPSSVSTCVLWRRMADDWERAYRTTCKGPNPSGHFRVSMLGPMTSPARLLDRSLFLNINTASRIYTPVLMQETMLPQNAAVKIFQ